MDNFKELNLSPDLFSAIEELGYTAPTPIQAQTLPILLGDRTDFIGLAATGTGKTATFSIPLLEKLNSSRREVQALVLCPTRELAIQVTGQINLLGKNKRIVAVPIYGGAGYGEQMKGLRQGAQIVVATPGRLIDHLERGTIQLDSVKTVVLDEADEMISMGFKEEIESILERLTASEYNTWLFSATMSKEIRRIADRFLTEPQMVQVNKSEMLSGTVQQIFYKTRESDKSDILCKLIDMADEFYGLVFCQTKALVTDLTTLLTSRGYKVDCLHGDKDQAQRERTMKAFRERKVSILVCTDVASRGIDVKDLTHVVNYSIPRELDNYVHRIGRTGRSGKTGLALSLVTPSHMGLIGRIEKMTQSKMKAGTIPTRKDIGAHKTAKVFTGFQVVSGFKRVEELLSPEWVSALDKMSKTEIVSRLLALNYPEIFSEQEKPKFSDQQQGQVIVRNTPSNSFSNSRGGFSGGGQRSFRERSDQRSDRGERQSRFGDSAPRSGGGFRSKERSKDFGSRDFGSRDFGGEGFSQRQKPQQKWDKPRFEARKGGGVDKPLFKKKSDKPFKTSFSKDKSVS